MTGRGIGGGRLVAIVIVLVAVMVGFVVIARPNWNILGRGDTTATNGDVIVQRLAERRELRVGVGTFMVPIVVCDETVIPFIDGRSKDNKTLDQACKGVGREGATLLVEGSVEAIIAVDDIKITTDPSNPRSVTIDVPTPSMQPPVIDARDVQVVARKTSIIPGTDLPDNYQALGADQGADAIAAVASKSGLPELARDSAKAQLHDLFSGAFDYVTVNVEKPDLSGP